jgi:hypothetical protein
MRDDNVSQYTYEFENNNIELETYEWDNVWWSKQVEMMFHECSI